MQRRITVKSVFTVGVVSAIFIHDLYLNQQDPDSVRQEQK